MNFLRLLLTFGLGLLLNQVQAAGEWVYSGYQYAPILDEIAVPILKDVKAIAAGYDHTVALKQDGSVVAWGNNSSGQTAVPVAAQSGVIAIAAGAAHTVARKQDGSVVAWGRNDSGQTAVPAAAQSGVIAIAAGGEHTVALKQDGSVVAWGGNYNGETAVPSAAQSGVIAIAAGESHTVALKQDGSVVAWGNNSFGQTTVPATAQSGVIAIFAGRYHTVALKQDSSVVAWGINGFGQTAVPAAAQSGVIAIAAGESHTVALKQDGSVVAWGRDHFGQVAVPAEAQSGVSAIAAGYYHTVVLKEDSSVVAWGRNDSGQTAVPAAAQSGVIAIAAGYYHTVALQQDGSVVAWGDDDRNQVAVPAAAQSGVMAIAAEYYYTVALKQDGSVVAWGYNDYGQTTVPTAAQSGVIAIAAGYGHTVARKQDGSVVAWGRNNYGQTAVPAAAQSGVIAIAAGAFHTVALKQDGSVVAWGFSGYGQTAVPAAAQSGVIAIAAGVTHTVALKQDGSVVAWGYNDYGQTAVPATAQSGVIAIAAGYYHTVALKQDGSVVAWGRNDYGQTAVPAAALSGVTAIAAGRNVTFYKLSGISTPAQVTQVFAAQVPGTHQVRISYNLAASAPCAVSVQAWLEDPGASLNIPSTAFTGDVGVSVSPGTGKAITLTVAETVAGVTTVKAPALQNLFTKNLRFKVIASTNPSQSEGNTSNLTLLDTQNPAIRDLAATAGDSSTYDQLNTRNKIGVFFSEGPELKTVINAIPAIEGYAFDLLYPWQGKTSWALSDFFQNPTGVIFATNDFIEYSDGAVIQAPLYQSLPGTDVLPWRILGDKLFWTPSATTPVVQFNARLNFKDPADHKVQLYKRFEFPGGLNYTPEGSGTGGAVTDYDTDRANIANPASTPKILKLVVVVHGWNTVPDTDPFTSGKWPGLLNNLSNEIQNKKVFAPGWDLYAYRWGRDSYTGNLNGNSGAFSLISPFQLSLDTFDASNTHASGGVGLAVENGTQAAEIGYQHGLVLGKLIRDHCTANGIALEKVHFIAHSAGTWVARSASLYLNATKGAPSLTQQITLLDPYNPSRGKVDWLALGYPSNVDDSALGSGKINYWANDAGAVRCENIFSDDTRIAGTNETYWTDPIQQQPGRTIANAQVGESAFGIGGGKYSWDAHSGPIGFFDYTTNPQSYLSGRPQSYDFPHWKRSSEALAAVAGWEHSLFMKEYRVAKPAPITDAGASILSSLLSPASRMSLAPAAASPWKQILVDVDGNAWVRAMLMPTNGSAAELAGPTRLGDDGTFTLPLSDSRVLTGTFDTSFSPARLTLAVDGVPFGQPTSIVQGDNTRRGVDADVNAAGNIVFSMVLADGSVGMSVMKDDTGTGWAASGTGTVDGNGNFQVTGLANLQVSGQLGEDGSLQTGDITVLAPQVPEIHVVDLGGNPILLGATLPVFPTTLVGATAASQSITVKNTGTVPLTGLTATLMGTNRRDFRIKGWDRSTLAAGSSMTVELLFAPGTSGRKSAAIRIASNDADENPSDIALIGTGSAPEIAIEAPAGKSLTDGKSTVSFKKTRMGSAGSKIKFFIRNTGSAPLKSLSVSNGGKDTKDFIIAQPKLTTVAVGANATFTVTFKPKAKGIRNAIIHVRNNDPNENPFDIRLTGEGLAAAKPASPLAVAVMEGLMNGEGPLVRRRAPASVIGTIVLRDGRKYLTLAVEKSPGDTNPTVEVSPNLLDWFSGHRHTTILLEDAGLLKVRDNTPVTQDSKRFIRLEPSRN